MSSRPRPGNPDIAGLATATRMESERASVLVGSHAFVDLETTGCNPVRDRIIEIAIVTVDDGRIVDEWSSLVDPETRIAPTIEGLTGIDNAMVASAPTFCSLREEILERLRGRVLVAHNARFDYGFLRNAFLREGVTFRATVLCTLRLARGLYPDLGRHGLDALIERFGLACEARHRALGDTRATLAFVDCSIDQLGATAVAAAVERQRCTPSLPSGLKSDSLDEAPDGPGVYLLYGRDDTLLYVGKSKCLRRRILDHFRRDHRTRRAAELVRTTHRVDWIETAGELGALLREAELVKRLQPMHNRRLRRHARPVVVAVQEAASGYLAAEVTSATVPARWPGDAWYGPFGDRRAALRWLQRAADEQGLCPRCLGLETGRAGQPCFARQLGRCRGACTGEQSAVQYNLRVMEALASRRIHPWPWSGPIVVREQSPSSGQEEAHVIHHWRYLGSARDSAEVAELAEDGGQASFDRDHYRILQRWLTTHPDVATCLGAVTPRGEEPE